MKKKNHLIYLSVFLIHLLLVCIAFTPFRLNPDGVLLCSWGDGLKNMYTLLSYVHEPITNGGILKYNATAYPFGDYVYYTDNTPLFSIPFRFFCHYIWDISAHTAAAFNIFIISNIILCGLLVYHVFRRLFANNSFAFIMAIVLPWTNMQILRIVRGHFNLSFTSLMLLAIYLVMLWHKYRQQKRKQVLFGIAMCILSFISFMAHGYYLPIVTIFIAAMLFCYGIYHFRQPQGKFSLFASVLYAVVAAGICWLLVVLTDKYLPMRSVAAHGYDWMEQKVRFSALFTANPFNTVYFPISRYPPETEPERAAYLGNIGLFTLAVVLILSFVNLRFRQKVLLINKAFFKDTLLAPIFFGSLVMLSISMGELYYTAVPAEQGFKIVNILNPFFYIHLFTDRVEQFRSLERFVYPFFFGFYIWITYLLIKLFDQYGRVGRLVILLPLFFLGGVEVKDNIDRINSGIRNQNLLSSNIIDRMPWPQIDFSKYQATLPLPYYCCGSEVYEYNLEPFDDWLLFNWRLQLHSRIPSMAQGSISRMPVRQNIELIRMVADDVMSNDLRSRLNDKPILVVVDQAKLASGALPPLPTDNAKSLYLKTCNFLQRNNARLRLLDSINGIAYYEWHPFASN